jgi:hypothetical protein
MYEKGADLTGFHTYANTPSVGRKKLWTERLTLPLTEEAVKRMDVLREEGEARLDLIREAIERELKRREKKKCSQVR